MIVFGQREEPLRQRHRERLSGEFGLTVYAIGNPTRESSAANERARSDLRRLFRFFLARLFILVLIFAFAGASAGVVDADAADQFSLTYVSAASSAEMATAGNAPADCCVECPQAAPYRPSDDESAALVWPQEASSRLIYALVNETVHSIENPPPRKPPPRLNFAAPSAEVVLMLPVWRSQRLVVRLR